MGYIYCITNLINNKRYVGKTISSVEERFKEHVHDSQKAKCNKRPLYSAFNKYGVENFIIEELECVECDLELSNREIYWIQELQTYGKNGYNATKGGDGAILYDYLKIIELYNIGYTCKKVAEKIGSNENTVRNVLKAHNIKIRSGSTKKINQFDLDGNYIQHFWGSVEVAHWLVDNGLAKSINCKRHITDCCNKKEPHAYGYKWEYAIVPD